MSIIQISALIFFAFTLSRVVLRWLDGSQRTSDLVLWLFIWISLAIVVIYPELTATIARWVGIGRGTDVVLYVAVALLFYIAFRTNVMIERLDQTITKIVRHDALRDLVNDESKPE